MTLALQFRDFVKPGLAGLAQLAFVIAAGSSGGSAWAVGGDDWNSAALQSALDYARGQSTSAVVIVHRGEIIAQRYWAVTERAESRYPLFLGGQSAAGAPIEDVASLQKSVVSLLAGIALDQGLLELETPVSAYLGAGWSRAGEHEAAITVRHLLSMTSGLTPGLEHEASAGTLWRYNTRAYSQLPSVLEKVTDQDIATLTARWLTEPLGLEDTAWRERPWVTASVDANPLGLYTSASDLARIGELILARGVWDGCSLVSEDYLDAATSPSQSLNPAYGFLWWLNGYALQPPPGEAGQDVLAAAAPEDLVAAQGALGRKLYIVPSLDLVVVRLGDAAADNFNEHFWSLLMAALPARSK
ncbi:serine hydrolase domain-containing protein [Kineobactrum salinum]|uniref:Serine hydrolase n=1 Tax=Kineobactrum salinum TaxID=2708301 RepID=A0A6C0U5D7_9GAMM|nr:serine hydrolase [Kineobactrum salinum]QIB67196.1 serine hydrolase [Kineobactrum salinum]